MRIFRNISILLLFCALSLVSAHSMAARTEGIAVVVNEDAITHSDVDDRMNLVIASSGLPNTQDTRDKLVGQIISVLVDERIRLQEAKKLDLDVTQGEIAEGFATIAQQNNFEAPEFRAVISKSGLNIKTMEEQIRAQIAWSKVVQARLRPQVVVSDSDIDAYLERLAANTGKTEYRVAEIFLPVESAQEEGQTRALADNLVKEIRGGKATFFKLAQQFSKSAGSTQGGDLGWVAQGQLQKELDAALPYIEKNSVSEPVRTTAGYHILAVLDQRTLSAENLPAREEVRTNLGLQRLERLQRRYLLDLKSAAFIEDRLGL